MLPLSEFPKPFTHNKTSQHFYGQNEINIRQQDFNKEAERLATFYSFHAETNISTLLLAANGFIYVGSGKDDNIQCYSCKKQMSNLKDVDDISKVHLQMSPECQFLHWLFIPSNNHSVVDNIQTDADLGVQQTSQVHYSSANRTKPLKTNVRKISNARLRNTSNSTQSRLNTSVIAQATENSQEAILVYSGASYVSSTNQVNPTPALNPSSNVPHNNMNTSLVPNQATTSPAAAAPAENIVADEARKSSDLNQPDGTQTQETGALPSAAQRKKPTYSELGIITERPKRAEYALKVKRIETYSSWPRHHHLSPENLSDAGFYYAGYGDCTRCFYCGGGLRNWEEEDDVLVEHARWFPKCAFIRQQMGQVFVDTVQELNKELQKIPFDKVVERMGMPKASFRLENKHTPLKHDPAVVAVIGLGFNEKNVLEMALRIKEEYDSNLISSDALLDKLIMEGFTTKFSDIPRGERMDPEKLRELKESNNQMRQQIICKICMDKEVAVVFLPCGHMVSCTDCASAMKDCPLCRKNVRGIVRAFISEAMTT